MFFEVLANKPVCQEMLRTILEDEELIVQDVITQNSEKNLYGRSVRLDALCTLGNGEKCNIEIQRSDNDDHLDVYVTTHPASLYAILKSEQNSTRSQKYMLYLFQNSMCSKWEKQYTM